MFNMASIVHNGGLKAELPAGLAACRGRALNWSEGQRPTHTL